MTLEEIVAARMSGQYEFAVLIDQLGGVVPASIGSRHGDRFIVVPRLAEPRPVPAPRYVATQTDVIDTWDRYVASGIDSLNPEGGTP